MKKYDHTLKNHISYHGFQIQKAIAIGEIGELLTLFGREAQGRATNDEWIDEIADCLIMLRQLALMYGIEKVENRINKKIKGL